MNTWTVSGPDKITFDEQVETLHVRVLGGAVNVVGADGPARLEVTELVGEPLLVSLDGGVLTVAYKDLSWSELTRTFKAAQGVQALKHFFGSLGRKRKSVVSLAVPVGSEVRIGSVSADVTVSGINGKVASNTVSGETTLVGLTGQIAVNSVSGNLDAQDVAGQLHVNTVSGALTVIAGTADRVLANTVSGEVTLDLDVATPTDIKVTTVTGAVGIRLPSLADTRVEAGTTTGRVTSTFDELTVDGTWGAKRLTGQLGTGNGKLAVTTVSGAITVLRRPEPEDDRPTPELPTGHDRKEA